jgi:prevent-host-death family protein
MIKTLSISEARDRLGHFVRKVGKTSTSYAITKKGSAGAILISHEEYESYKATLEILSDEKDLARIEQGIAELNVGDSVSFEEVFGEPLNAPVQHQSRRIIPQRS